ncbi:MBL fold metallo-hydrolase [Clostridium sp. MCC353]|nr:MBL fold metallo-hydrolase [Clostridium sp. MCC353]
MRAERILDDIYEVKLPLKGSSLKELSCYIIKGQDRSCIIDVGFATEECDRILREAVEELGLDKKHTDILLTHTHQDHCGNLPNLYQEFGGVCCSRWDSIRISGNDPVSKYDYLKYNFLKCGMSTSLLEQMPKDEDLDSSVPLENIRVLSDGDVLTYGKYRLKVIDLKGHMPGLIGFYDEEQEILFPGDHVLNKITPNIGFYGEEYHSLTNYVANLKKVRDLKVKHVFPAHRGPIKDLQARVDEILEHHEERLDEITGVLYAKPMCAYEVAGKVKWYYKEGNFQAYPVVMKWMAASEILAHLQYLYERGEIVRAGGEGESYIYRYVN